MDAIVLDNNVEYSDMVDDAAGEVKMNRDTYRIHKATYNSAESAAMDKSIMPPAICPRCGKRVEPFTMGDGVPVCDCEPEKEEHDEKYIFFNRKYWKVEDLKLNIVEVDDD